jgi:hypothetical protein
MNQTPDPESFVICVAAKPEDDLVVGKVYKVIPDAEAVRMGCVRVTDESGDDYLYPASWFVAVDLSAEARGRLATAG